MSERVSRTLLSATSMSNRTPGPYEGKFGRSGRCEKTVVFSDTCNSLWSKASFLSDQNCPMTTDQHRGRQDGAPCAGPHAAPPAAARGRPPVLLELGDDLVGNEPHGIH